MFIQQLVFNSVTNCLGPRKFLHSGKLFKAKSSKELYGFLFNDFLLLTQVSLATPPPAVCDCVCACACLSSAGVSAR